MRDSAAVATTRQPIDGATAPRRQKWVEKEAGKRWLAVTTCRVGVSGIRENTGTLTSTTEVGGQLDAEYGGGASGRQDEHGGKLPLTSTSQTSRPMSVSAAAAPLVRRSSAAKFHVTLNPKFLV
ncbi:hypothetical protein R3P38DRAFT_2808879 [Favolaschia claudopus]|uniref:Uncharacterized protein n=1 Tax=Favolaschia claudopus TaxID=2862362 RepID=A0AAV9ZEL1_9AGAR